MFKCNHSFLVSRFQPFHNGHKSLVDKMIKESKNATIILGLAQENRTPKNPFTKEERIQMVKNIYGDSNNINIFALDDIEDDNKWYDYVLSNVREKSAIFGKPEGYYCGGLEEASWFDKGELSIEILDRNKQIDSLRISATQIRNMIKNGNANWKNYIPKENIKFVEDFFLKHKVL